MIFICIVPVTILIVSQGFSEAQCLTLNKQQWRTVVQPRGANTWTKFFVSLLVMMLILLMSGKDEQQLLQDSRMLWPTVSKAALRSHITICCLQRKSCKSLEAYVNSLTASEGQCIQKLSLLGWLHFSLSSNSNRKKMNVAVICSQSGCSAVRFSSVKHRSVCPVFSVCDDVHVQIVWACETVNFKIYFYFHLLKFMCKFIVIIS